jgi:hypothetical protein
MNKGEKMKMIIRVTKGEKQDKRKLIFEIWSSHCVGDVDCGILCSDAA